ncbi:hypothetical protein SRHO_G00106700 [Serrasalmus rhombeus]
MESLHASRELKPVIKKPMADRGSNPYKRQLCTPITRLSQKQFEGIKLGDCDVCWESFELSKLFCRQCRLWPSEQKIQLNVNSGSLSWHGSYTMVLTLINISTLPCVLVHPKSVFAEDKASQKQQNQQRPATTQGRKKANSAAEHRGQINPAHSTDTLKDIPKSRRKLNTLWHYP